jgi:hypothetical protein
MATRYKTNSKSTFGVAPIKSGYDDANGTPVFSIPPVGIVDADRSLFNLFENEIPFMVKTPDGIKKVPVVFAAGEKWAMIKRGAPRDKNGTIILPVITVGRTTISQTPNEDIAGRGINQQTGEIIVKRRLDGSNRNFQGWVNRLFLKNQTNAAVGHDDATVDNQLTTSRDVGDLKDDPTVSRGGLLKPSLRENNVWETIVIPAPQFYTATYEVVVWAQYVQQMNDIIQQVISSFLPQGNQWRLETDAGYWFIASVDQNVYNAQNNFEDMSQEERMIKYSFTIKVPGYIFASDTPGAPVPIRRYVSNPEVSFNIAVDDSHEVGVQDPWLGADDPTLPKTDNPSTTEHQRRDGKTRLYPGKENPSEHDPALESRGRDNPEPARYRKVSGVDSKGNPVTKHIRIKRQNNHTGETVYTNSFDLAGITILDAQD